MPPRNTPPVMGDVCAAFEGGRVIVKLVQDMEYKFGEELEASRLLVHGRRGVRGGRSERGLQLRCEWLGHESCAGVLGLNLYNSLLSSLVSIYCVGALEEYLRFTAAPQCALPSARSNFPALPESFQTFEQ